ncbi:MAG TPA: efflux RND transporter periplasmic adaptor subunit [Puia sp.]|uniref:efflux RND transporter periplasmic adaptor subunit n=1 Tax=Puia sp. TaxID=2045100 RepID=UPI002BB1BE58|nr:efflux RND transporter periplasmic adaptor subunit [Puia sp.]HVU98873.1 efflux RND transporter periplasmic adaptor subunit [Puia sp.]
MKRAIIIIVILLLAGAAAWYFFFRKEEKPVLLTTERPRYGYISKSVTATGTVQPVDTVAVGSQVSGTIKVLNADFNAKVKKGQLLAELDKSLFVAQVDQYTANLALAKANLTFQKSTFDRQSQLYSVGAISKADYENAQSQYQTAQAQVQSVQAQLNGAQKNLDYASIYSPVDGVVMTRNVSVGQTVAASFNTPTLFIIAKDISKMQVQAAVSEADIGDVKVGLRVTFTVDAYPDITFTGTVNQVRLEPVVSANVVTYSTIITAPNQDLKLRPGMTANIFIFTREVDSAMLITAKALKYKPDDALGKQYKIFPDTVDEREVAVEAKRSSANPLSPPRHRHDSTSRQVDTAPRTGTPAFVWVKVGDSLIEKKITTGLNNDTRVQVLSGLDLDDEVVNGEEAAAAAGARSGAVRSPFMPARRGGGTRSGGGSGGGRGGGGGR